MRAKYMARTVANGMQLVAGAFAVSMMTYWAVPALDGEPPPVAIAPAVGVAAESQPAARTETSLGCADSSSAADLDAFFAERRGPLLGWDNPHVTEIGPERWVWMVHDTYLDHTGRATDLEAIGHQIQNAAFIQEGTCFTVVHSGALDARSNFERGDGRIAPQNFLWPLGSEVDGDRLWMFWAETTTQVPAPPHGHGISRHPLATWLASYDLETLERLSFEPAPNSGVEPVFGFAVASDDDHSYLFGNSNQLNLWRDGGFDNGPHTATRMYLARVPRGKLDTDPEYWNGAGWSPDAADSTTISERFWTENTMQPRFIDGQWLSVVKRDGFFGADIWLEAAVNPWGPWVVMESVVHEPRAASVDKNSYQPVILPWSSSTGGVSIAVSENAIKWHHAVTDPSLYRPAMFDMAWPEDYEQRIESAIKSLTDP